MQIRTAAWSSVVLSCALAGRIVDLTNAARADAMADRFASPPADARPWVYWFWLNGNITREGITADLEAMKRVGIGGVLIMEVDQGIPKGPVAFMSPPWRELFKHVVAEAQRLGLEVNMNNDAGWNGSGGPWIRPEHSMQKVVWTETNVEGPRHFDDTLPQPNAVAGFYRDIAVLAFPATGDYRIENIPLKACYQVGYVSPGVVETKLPAEQLIDRTRIADLTPRMSHDGRLEWNVPAGQWTVMRFGHTSTGVENAPSPESGRGLECDKLSREGIEANFGGMIAKLIADVGPAAGRVLTVTHIDSWENGAQNWTARMPEEFRARRGYDLLPFLPVMTGRVVESLEISERFLWDLRQTISDLVVENYAGHLQTLARRGGLRLTIEAYGGPCDDLRYAGRCDEPMGEFWIGGSALNVCKGMASAAHTYGKPIVGAEAFTADDRERWRDHPASIKALGDRAFCEGINRFVFHRYALQPWPDRRPGMTMGPWGVHYERTQTWWEMTPPWHTYLARCQFMLRQGRFAPDICYLQPEAAPQGAHDHRRRGYDFDQCSAEVVLTRMAVKDGRLVLPDGLSYRLLVLPGVNTMTPALLRKIRDLVQAGATVVGPRPLKSPSLTDYPTCDDEVKKLADEVWGNCDGRSVKEHRLGQGRVVWGVTAEELLAQEGVRPDFSSRARLGWIHRVVGDRDVYFVANPQPYGVQAACAFRVSGKCPELWWPDSGLIERAGMFEEKDGCTSVPLTLGPSGSVFVVFARGAGPQDPVVALTRDGKPLLATADIAPKIVVKKAAYGVLTDPQRIRDVRGKVQEKVDRGEHSFQVARMAEGDDPAEGVVKTLDIEYTIGEQEFAVRGRDPESVHLTDDASRIVVEKATYGVLTDPQRTRDVRDKLQHLLDTGERDFQVARMAEGDDPAFMVVKTLVVEYTIAGRRMTFTGTDPEPVTLTPHPAVPEPVAGVRWTADGRPLVEACQPGRYELRTATGRSRRVEVPDLPAPLEIGGPWEVRFAPGWGAPERVTLEKLDCWSRHSDPGVRHFSGMATYTAAFKLPAEMPARDRRIILDLGKVQVMAQVKLNHRDLGVLWKPPYQVDVTDIVNPGENSLEIKVVNLWPNRLIGDEQLPEDSDRNPEGTLKSWPQWLLEGKPSPTGRHTFSTWRLWKKDDPLPESGLLGPVRLRPVQVAR